MSLRRSNDRRSPRGTTTITEGPDNMSITARISGFFQQARDSLMLSGLDKLDGRVGGLIGGAIDATSGAMNDLKPNPLIVTLRTPAEEAAARAAAPAQAATQQ